MSLHYFTFSANLNEQSVWLKSACFGEMLTNMRVLLSPSKYFCNRYVSFEFRKGTCWSFLARAVMTCPRVESDLLIAWVYFILSPSTLLWDTLSLPARSTRFKDPFLYSSLLLAFLRLMLILKIKCDREECSLQLVSATFLFLVACSKME